MLFTTTQMVWLTALVAFLLVSELYFFRSRRRMNADARALNREVIAVIREIEATAIRRAEERDRSNDN